MPGKHVYVVLFTDNTLQVYSHKQDQRNHQNGARCYEVSDNTKIIYIETPSNPLLKIIDIKAIARLADSKGLVSVIDNTFATPINQNPLNFGIDVIIHSGTKYLGGHSDICFGAVVTSAGITKEIHKSAVN